MAAGFRRIPRIFRPASQAETGSADDRGTNPQRPPLDLRTVGSQGSVERAGDRSKKTEAQRDVLIPAATRDSAQISSASRASASAVEGLAERARSAGGDREQIVAAAMKKLLGGELDSPAAIESAARAMLDRGFKTV